MRLIDADEVIARIDNPYQSAEIARWLRDAPTIEERKKGKWRKIDHFWFHDDYQCSVCGNTLDFNGVNAGRGDARFCPNCGADMRQREE